MVHDDLLRRAVKILKDPCNLTESYENVVEAETLAKEIEDTLATPEYVSSDTRDYNDIYACDLCGGPTFPGAPDFAAKNNAVIGELMVLCNRCRAAGYKLVILHPVRNLETPLYPASIEKPFYLPQDSRDDVPTDGIRDPMPRESWTTC